MLCLKGKKFLVVDIKKLVLTKSILFIENINTTSMILTHKYLFSKLN